MKKLIHNQNKFSWRRTGPVVAVVALVGAVVIWRVFAAGTPVAFEAESGIMAAGATVATATGQSGSGVVKFGAGTTTGPCAVSTPNVPDGPDPWGGCFPGASNTGVPKGTVLTNYSGPSGYQDVGTLVIDKKIVNSELRFYGNSKVTITNSLIKGNIDFDLTSASSTLTITDSTIEVGGGIIAGIGNKNWTGTRINVSGATTGASCAGNCVMRDSYLHGNYLPPDADYHLGGYLSNGGTGITVIHSSLFCDAAHNSFGGNCSGDLNMFGDFAPISTVLIEKNLLGANVDNSYCTYAGDATPGAKPYPRADHVVYRDNIFQRGTNGKCASYGPVSSFNPAGTGNEWTNNKWDNGTILPSAN